MSILQGCCAVHGLWAVVCCCLASLVSWRCTSTTTVTPAHTHWQWTCCWRLWAPMAAVSRRLWPSLSLSAPLHPRLTLPPSLCPVGGFCVSAAPVTFLERQEEASRWTQWRREVLLRAIGAHAAAQAFISWLLCERDKHFKARSEIHSSSAAPPPPPPLPHPPGVWGTSARQTVGTSNKCVTAPSNKLSGLIVSIHWFHHLKPHLWPYNAEELRGLQSPRQ